MAAYGTIRKNGSLMVCSSACICWDEAPWAKEGSISQSLRWDCLKMFRVADLPLFAVKTKVSMILGRKQGDG